jgi:hypothetical protein
MELVLICFNIGKDEEGENKEIDYADSTKQQQTQEEEPATC